MGGSNDIEQNSKLKSKFAKKYLFGCNLQHKVLWGVFLAFLDALGPSCDALGSLLGALGALLGRSWGDFGRSGGGFGACWALLGALGVLSGHFWVILFKLIFARFLFDFCSISGRFGNNFARGRCPGVKILFTLLNF